MNKKDKFLLWDKWDKIQKQIIINQLPELQNLTILDFGSGNNYLPYLLDESNNFVCIEPNIHKFQNIYKKNNIYQIENDFKFLSKFKDNCFDLIFCHNVFEYLDSYIIKKVVFEFSRILKPEGSLSLVKHNKFGRILEQILFKNDFDKYKNVYLENQSYSERFGKIKYYKEKDIINYSNNKFVLVNKFGLRTFYDLQSNMELQNDEDWIKKIIDTELFFCKTQEFIDISFLHHLIYKLN